jgi:serine/threonine-protein kinase HipA
MKEILVYMDWLKLPATSLLGILRSEISKGEEIFSFEYNQKWIESGYAQDLDPDLKLYTGPQYLSDEKPNFGLFLDSSPDRWGRMLMERREAIIARKSGNPKKRLSESDFLLGVNDDTRMGAIRFKLNKEENYLEDSESIQVPPMTSIRELEQASLNIEDDDFFKNKEAEKWLKIMMAPGSSLGGARPKASVRHTDGSLWIAKFPSKSDQKDSGIWELLVNRMAKKLNINVAKAEASIFSQKQHTYLTKRFDRSKKNERLHFASAMTLLGYKDGNSHKEGVSYLELVDLIETYGALPEKDLQELWRRIVFSVGIANTDDHLRNHGFLLTRQGWTLSPAYDINPNEYGTGLSLNISEDDNSLSYELCQSVAEYFRWSPADAKKYISKTQKEISKWNQRAKELKIPNSQINYMEAAFDQSNRI